MKPADVIVKAKALVKDFDDEMNTVATMEEQEEMVVDFLTDMEILACSWYNRPEVQS